MLLNIASAVVCSKGLTPKNLVGAAPSDSDLHMRFWFGAAPCPPNVTPVCSATGFVSPCHGRRHAAQKVSRSAGVGHFKMHNKGAFESLKNMR